MPVKNFYDLPVWREALDFVTEIYTETKIFPSEEKFGLTNQIRRSSVSITSNIAEGFERYHKKDKIRFYHHARASLAESESQIMVAHRLKFLREQTVEKLLEMSKSIGKQLNGLIKAVDRDF